MNKDIKILAIESSCDETAAAVIGNEHGKPVILSNIVSSQIDLHAKTGGVVPEVASRAHMEAIVSVITEALLQARNAKQLPAAHNRHPELACLADRRDSEPVLNLIQESSYYKSGFQVKPGMTKVDELHNTDDSNAISDSIRFLQNEITHIAVTAGPGLIGSLLVGFNAAKTIAYALNKPIIPLHHIEGHIYSAMAQKLQISNLKFLNNIDLKFKIRNLKFPVLALVVSGGHSSLILMRDHGKYEIIGQTLDDAAGEAFDKVAKLLDLGYPGGPAVSKLAEEFRKNPNNQSRPQQDSTSLVTGHLKIKNCELIFPRPIINDGSYNFSFSGLKTAVLREVKGDSPCVAGHVCRQAGRQTRAQRGQSLDKLSPEISHERKAAIAAAFEDAAVDVLVTKTMRAVKQFKPKTVVLAGGVAANSHLRGSLETAIATYCSRPEVENSEIDMPNLSAPIEASKNKIAFRVPPLELCGDNAAMIGLAAYYHLQKNDVKRWDQARVDSSLGLASK